MEKNILKEADVVKMFIHYTMPNGLLKKEQVTLRYMDNSGSFFAGDIPTNYTKPKKNSAAELVVYTPDGIYKSSVKYVDSSVSLNEVLYHTTIPKIWTFSQRRSGTRKCVELDMTLNFNDGMEIKGKTYNLSNGGFSFYTDANLTTVQQRFPVKLTLEFPEDLIINFPDRKLSTEVKCQRIKDAQEYGYNVKLIVFKFTGLTNEQALILKNYLLRIV